MNHTAPPRTTNDTDTKVALNTSRPAVRTIRRAIAATLAATLALAGCGDDKPKRSDVDDRAVIVYPGATKGVEEWFPADKGTTIDGEKFDDAAFLRVAYTLAEPVTADKLFKWAQQSLQDLGWTHSREERTAWYFSHKVSGTTHAIQLVLTGDARVQETLDLHAVTHYTITYTIY